MPMLIRGAEVVLKIENHFGHHKFIKQISSNKLKSLLAILAREIANVLLLNVEVHGLQLLDGAGMHQLTHVDSPLLDEDMNNHTQKLGVVFINMVGTILAIDGRAIVVFQKLGNCRSIRLHKPSKLVHLRGALFAAESSL